MVRLVVIFIRFLKWTLGILIIHSITIVFETLTFWYHLGFTLTVRLSLLNVLFLFLNILLILIILINFIQITLAAVFSLYKVLLVYIQMACYLILFLGWIWSFLITLKLKFFTYHYILGWRLNNLGIFIYDYIFLNNWGIFMILIYWLIEVQLPLSILFKLSLSVTLRSQR